VLRNFPAEGRYEISFEVEAVSALLSRSFDSRIQALWIFPTSVTGNCITLLRLDKSSVFGPARSRDLRGLREKDRPTRQWELPTARVAYACRRVPRNCDDFVEAFLNPDRVGIVEVHDGSNRFAVVKMAFNVRPSGKAADARLNPGVAGDHLRLGKAEILHNPETFRVRAEIGVPKARASVLVGVSERQLVTERIFFEEAEGVADSNVVVHLRMQSRPIEIGAEHYIEIRARSRFTHVTGASALRLVLSLANGRK
jgi:hypothetical protein